MFMKQMTLVEVLGSLLNPYYSQREHIVIIQPFYLKLFRKSNNLVELIFMVIGYFVYSLHRELG